MMVLPVSPETGSTWTKASGLHGRVAVQSAPFKVPAGINGLQTVAGIDAPDRTVGPLPGSDAVLPDAGLAASAGQQRSRVASRRNIRIAWVEPDCCAGGSSVGLLIADPSHHSPELGGRRGYSCENLVLVKLSLA